MNIIQRFRLAFRAAPKLEALIQSAGGTIDRLAEQVSLYRAREDDRQHFRNRLAAEYREALAMASGGPWERGVKSESLRESGASVVLKEQLAELELAFEDQGWQREIAYGQMEFSRFGIQQIILMSRLYFIKNPLIRRGVLVSSYYIFGRGVEVSSPEESVDKILKKFMTDPRNMRELCHSGLVAKEQTLHTDGNIFWALFSDPQDGSVLVRTIDATEICEVITDPNDASIPWYYHRRWNEMEFNESTGLRSPIARDAWYIALGCKNRPRTLGGHPVEYDKSSGEPIYIVHQKVGALAKWHFGCPLVYPALDWARAYKWFLEDWATITRALARFAFQVETKGGAPAIAALKQTLATTLANDGSIPDQNPAPVTGSSWISGPGTTISPMKTAGATTEPEQGRRVFLMVCAAFGLPETFFGDASVGSLATAESLDRPTELKFLEAQERWRETLQLICGYVIERSKTAPKGRLREARELAHDIIKEEDRKKELDSIDAAVVDVKFPSLLEHNIQERVKSIVAALTLDGQDPGKGIDLKTGIGLLLEELGVEDVQTVLDAMFPEGSYDPKRKPEDMRADPAPSPATIKKAVAELKRAAEGHRINGEAH